MSAEDRRTAIVDAVLPLVVQRGELPSTREIAETAGIAEGTIYRVFADKTELLHAVAERAVRPPEAMERVVEEARALPDVRARIVRLAERSQERMREVQATMMALRPAMMAAFQESPRGADAPDGPPAFFARAQEELLERLTAVFALEPAALRVPPALAASAFRALTFGSQHPGMAAAARLSPEQVADLLLHGIAAPAAGEGV